MITDTTSRYKKCASACLGWLLLLFIMGMGLHLPAQTREELERSKQQIEQEIRTINQMLQETKKTAELNLGQLVMINTRISSRERLLQNIDSEISIIDRRIRTLTNNIKVLEEDLAQLQEAYAAMIRQAYRNRDTTRSFMFILSSEDFNQAYLRLRYMQQYARHRQLQAAKIAEVGEALNVELAALREERSRQQALLAEQRQALLLLAEEKSQQGRTISQLQRKERELLQRLRQQEREARALQQSIERVIAEELRRAQELARTEGRVTTDMFALTPEERILSDNFAENQGKLLWPVERGVITSRFGEQPHPVLRGIKINNNGVEISTAEGASARAIFEGEVSRVITVPGGTYAVIIRHGEYLTVYSNLAVVSVKNGDKVYIRQDIGVISTDTAESKTHVNLQIWRGNDKLNPELWIASQR